MCELLMHSDDDRTLGGTDSYPSPTDGNVTEKAGSGHRTTEYLPEAGGNNTRVSRRHSEDTTRPPHASEIGKRYLDRDNIRTPRHNSEDDSVGNRAAAGHEGRQSRPDAQRSGPYRGNDRSERPGGSQASVLPTHRGNDNDRSERPGGSQARRSSGPYRGNDNDRSERPGGFQARRSSTSQRQRQRQTGKIKRPG
ncbi:MAG: hypothetical protein ACNYPG_06265 [Candidatus Porifericomitaceae bacterium WSBS_2022_MAG_OTU9]